MYVEFRIEKDLMKPMRYNLGDVIRFYGEELKEAGFDLEKEIFFSVSYDYADLGHLLRVQQDNRFRVRPVNEFYPYAII